ncbi:MerR family transcriptional regulator [Flavisolibacter nicotianae]|uniref:MerR family transcriptional regulator n=1 Tax=Flavisolibacter nicotianae TaxID=2364882 RepID=UPI000EABEB44|nr:MerR family transcriptional regulator [Flavisolibacter nicotianae]
MSFTIKELESLSGIKAHTIRIWEQRYQFLKPSRTTTNIRRYNNDELKTLLTIALLNKYGYKISHIDEMQPEQRTEAALRLQEPNARDEYIINELIGCMIDLKSTDFESLLNQQIRERGIEQTITGLVFSFLDRVGILWQTNRLRPVQEHIVSAIIRQKIIHAIEGLPFAGKTQPLFILFLPEGEHHELGLLYVYYLLRKQGLPVIYLGANVPLNDMEYIIEVKKPDYVYSHLTTFPNLSRLNRLLHQLQNAAGHASLILSGHLAQVYRKGPAEKITLLQSLQAVASYINSLQ